MNSVRAMPMPEKNARIAGHAFIARVDVLPMLIMLQAVSTVFMSMAVSFSKSVLNVLS